MALDKIQAVRQVSESLSNQSVSAGEVGEVSAPSAERFQSLMDSSQGLKPPSFERVDATALVAELQQTEELQQTPLFSEEGRSAQKNGSATDQEGRRNPQETDEEIEEVEGVKSKQSAGTSSLADEAGKTSGAASLPRPTPETIATQTREVVAKLDQVKTQLSQAKGEVKPSYQALLRNHLSHIDDSVKIALNKAGVEYTPAPAIADGAKGSNPFKRFINMVGNAQRQLEQLPVALQGLSAEGQQVSPAKMLAIQLKMYYVQQEIELFSSLVNKALESTKTIMNVQV